MRANTIGFLIEGAQAATEHAEGEFKAEDEVKGAVNHERLSAYEPEPALSAFLAQGEKPIYIGFGSMPLLSPSATYTACATALKQLNLRGGKLFFAASVDFDVWECKLSSAR